MTPFLVGQLALLVSVAGPQGVCTVVFLLREGVGRDDAQSQESDGEEGGDVLEHGGSMGMMRGGKEV
jgi:hypothetical protein